jgi:acetylornithine deacetylase/succinyl-diaminopimelate desuccinylase-like protein
VRGPKHDLHSGRYGGAVLNPLQALSDIVSGLHDRTGKVAIPGFYGSVNPPDRSERQSLRCACKRNRQILADLDLPMGWGEPGYTLGERMTLRPALTINGITGGYTGPGAKSVIPSHGTARFSIRLVPDQNPMEIARLLSQHVQSLTHPAVQSQLSIAGGSRPIVLPKNSAVMQAASRAIEQTWGVSPVLTRSGGSIPLVEQLHRRFRVPIVLMGFGLPDDDIHAPNEKMNLSNFFRGIETVIRFFAEYAAR